MGVLVEEFDSEVAGNGVEEVLGLEDKEEIETNSYTHHKEQTEAEAQDFPEHLFPLAYVEVSPDDLVWLRYLLDL